MDSNEQSVGDLAKVVGANPEKLLLQIQLAGGTQCNTADLISEDEKHQFLHYLKNHAAVAKEVLRLLKPSLENSGLDMEEAAAIKLVQQVWRELLFDNVLLRSNFFSALGVLLIISRNASEHAEHDGVCVNAVSLLWALSSPPLDDASHVSNMSPDEQALVKSIGSEAMKLLAAHRRSVKNQLLSNWIGASTLALLTQPPEV